MADPLTADDAEDSTGARENFIGRVEFSREDCDCEEVCSKGSGQFERDIDHFAYIEILDDTYDGPLHVLGMDVNSGPMTKWMVMIGHLTDIFGNLEEQDLETYQDVLEFIEGRTFEWRDITWTENEEYPVIGESRDIRYVDIGRQNEPDSMLAPVRLVGDDELEELGAEVQPAVDDEVEI